MSHNKDYQMVGNRLHADRKCERFCVVNWYSSIDFHYSYSMVYSCVSSGAKLPQKLSIISSVAQPWIHLILSRDKVVYDQVLELDLTTQFTNGLQHFLVLTLKLSTQVSNLGRGRRRVLCVPNLLHSSVTQ